MPRKNKYFSNVQPYLDKIPKWYETLTEYQICERLGVSVAAWENYKLKYPELVEALSHGKECLADELRETLKKKAVGFHYTETKTTKFKNADGEEIVRVEESVKYAVPDTGAIHLLLKNIDNNWRNDDKATLDLKKQKLELDAKRAESGDW